MKPMRIGGTVPLLVLFMILICSSGCIKKKDFNIVGNWKIHTESAEGTMDEDYFLSFQGTQWSGEIVEGGVDIGDYLVFDKTVFIRNVAFSFQRYVSEPLGYRQLSFGCEVHYGDDHMNGSFLSFIINSPDNKITGNWIGTRQ